MGAKKLYCLAFLAASRCVESLRVDDDQAAKQPCNPSKDEIAPVARIFDSNQEEQRIVANMAREATEGAATAKAEEKDLYKSIEDAQKQASAAASVDYGVNGVLPMYAPGPTPPMAWTNPPTPRPTPTPTEMPTAFPTERPTQMPTWEPTPLPTENPTAYPTPDPTVAPTHTPYPTPVATVSVPNEMDAVPGAAAIEGAFAGAFSYSSESAGFEPSGSPAAGEGSVRDAFSRTGTVPTSPVQYSPLTAVTTS